MQKAPSSISDSSQMFHTYKDLLSSPDREDMSKRNGWILPSNWLRGIVTCVRVFSKQNMEPSSPFFEQAKIYLVLDQWMDAWWIALLLHPPILYTMLLDWLDSIQVQNTCSYNNITSNYFNSISKFSLEDKLNTESVVESNFHENF
jgi:hypothetical protein